MKALVFVSLTLLFADHSLYLSHAVLDLDKRELTIKVFSDDLDDVLKSFELSESWGAFGTKEDLISEYFYSRFLINKGAVALSFLSLSEENDACFLHFKLKEVPEFNTLVIKADYFMEEFPAQNNVIEVSQHSKKRFLRLTLDTPEAELALK